MNPALSLSMHSSKVLMLALIALLSGAGCGKKATPDKAKAESQPTAAAPAEQPAAEPVANQPAAPAERVSMRTLAPREGAEAPSPAAAPAPAERVATPTVPAQSEQDVLVQTSAELTRMLQEFVREEKRMPNSFEEMAARKMDTMPLTPKGTKWVINSANKTVELRRSK